MDQESRNQNSDQENTSWFTKTFQGETDSGTKATDFVLVQEPREQESGRRPRQGKGKKVAVMILALILAIGAGFGGGVAAVHYSGSNGAGGAAYQPITINPSGEMNIGEAVAAKVLPSVVGISTTREQISQTWGGIYAQEIPEGVGTGFIVDEKGYILTNSHVVSDGKAKTITVQLTDGREEQGTVLWNDTTLDLAIVKIDANDLVAAELGDSDTVNIGSYAAAIGNPLGLEFDRTVTQGGISGLNRTITVASGNSFQGATMEGLIQTDAAINSGNSGGPLLNNKGQVIGINTAKASSGEGMGFAIPINVAKAIVDEVRETGTYTKAYIGIRGADVADVAAYYRFSAKDTLGVETGAYVLQVNTDSPAVTGGLKEGDVIVVLDGKKIEGISELIKSLYKYKPGDKVELKVMRDKREMTIEVTLAGSDAAPQMPGQGAGQMPE